MDKKYLQDLWNWSNSQDPTLQERYTFEDWTNKLQSEGQYRQKFYDWIGTVDPTHSERRPYQSWEGMVAGVAQPTSKKKEESASPQPQEVISSATREMGRQQPLVYFQDLVRRADAAISQGKRSEYRQLKNEIENLYKQSGDVLNTEETKAEIDKLNQRYSNIFKEQEPIRFLDPAVEEKVPFKDTPKKQLDELAKKGATDVEYTPEERKVLMDIELNIMPNVDYDGINEQVQEELSDYSRRQVRTKRGMISAPYVDNSAQESINMAIDELVDSGKELTDQSILQRAAEIRTQQVKNAKEYNAIENYYEGASIVGKTEGQKEKQATLEAIKEKRKAHLVNFENKVNEIDDLALGLEEFSKISQKRALTKKEKIDYLDTFNKYTRLHRDLVENYENIENDTRLVGDFESELDAFKRNHTYITSGGAKATAALARIGAGLSGFAGMTRAAVYDLMGDEDAFEKAEVFVEKGEDINAWADSLLDGVSKSQQLDDAETVGDYAEWAGGMIIENTPQILINVLTGGKAVPFLSASAAGEKYMELYGDEAYSKGQKYLASILVGGGTAVSELLELSAFKKLWPSKKVAKAAVSKVGRKEFERAMSKGIKKSVKDRFKQAGTALAGVNQEGFSEVIDQLSRNAVNKYVLDQDVSLADGLGDAYLSGTVVGAGLGAAPHIFSGVVRPFINDPNGDIIKNINKIQKLKESLLEADENLKPVLQDRINQLNKQNEDLVQKAVKGLDNLSPKEIKDGIRTYEDLVKIKKEYQEVKNDETLSEEVKEATVDALQSRYNELVEKRKQLINKANAVQEQSTDEVPVQPDAAVSEEVEEGVPETEFEVTTQKSEEEITKRIEEIETTLSEDDKAIEDTGKSSLTKESREELQKELNELKDEQQTLAPEQGTRTPIEGTKLRDNIKRAVAKIFPKTDSFSFKNGKEMAAYALEKYGATVGETEGARVFVKEDGSVEILVNEELSDNTSFGHEIWHAVLLKSFGDSQKKFKDFRRGINKTLRQNGFEDLADELDNFAAQYGEDEVPSEEYLAQLGGILTSSNIDLSNLTPQQKSLLDQIKDLINSFAIELTGEPVFLEDATPADILDFMSTMSDMMARGEDVSGFIKDGTKKQATKTRAQVVGAFSGQLEKMGISVGTTNEKTGKTKVTNFDIASALNEYYNKTYGKIAPNDFSEKAVNAVSEYATTEMLFALSEFGENSGKGWYTEDYAKALETLSSLDESIKKDPKIKEVATAIIAVASNSSDVYTNLTRLIYGLDGFKTNKSVPLDVGTGKGASAISAGIKRYNQLLEKFENDPSQVAKFMQQIDTIANLKKKLLSEFKLSSYAQALKENLATNPEWNESETLPMSVLIFGPKIGAFYSNLSGLDGTPTIDRWCIRTIYRYKGDMRAKVSSKEMNAFMSDNKIEGASESDAFALAEEHAKLFNAILTGRGEYKGLEKSKRNAMLKPYRKGSQIWSKAKGVVNDIAEGADDTVSNKSQYGKDFRSFTKEVFEKARDMVAEKAGVKLSVSDVQAILWIYEKNLFGHLGVKQREDSTYSSAANSLVSKVNSGALTVDSLKSGDLKALSVADIETEGPMGDKFGSDVKSFKEGIDSRQKRSQEGVEVKTRAQKWPTSLTQKQVDQKLKEAGIRTKTENDKFLEDEGKGNETQRNNIKTYDTFVGGILDTFGQDLRILDIGAGFGIGAMAAKKQDVADIYKTYEPFPSLSDGKWEKFSGTKKPNYTKENQVPKGSADVIVSNAVLNVVPQDIRDGIVNLIGDSLAPGGKAYISVRGIKEEALAKALKNSKEGKGKNVYLSETEYYVPGVQGDYQKGFSPEELKAYVQDTLGNDYTVEVSKESFWKNSSSAPKIVVSKKGEGVLTRAQKASSERMQKELDGVIDKARKRGANKQRVFDDTLAYLQGSKAYEDASDTEREQMVRDLRKKLGVKEKSAPRVGRILGITDKMSSQNMKDLIEKIKAQVKATKNLIAAQKAISSQITKEVKELQSKGSISTGQMVAVLRRLQQVDLLNPESVAKFIDYMARVFKDAEYYKRVSDINRKRRAARKGAETKAGIADALLPLLQKVFSVDARVIPADVLDAYESLVNQFSERAVVLTLGDIDALTEQAKEVLNSIETELERAEALAEIFDNYENKILDDEGKVQFAQTINDMVDNGSITAEDAEIMKKYKSTILGPKETDKRSKEEIEEERQEKIEQIKSFKEVFFSLPTLDERNVARKLFELIKTSAIEKLDLKDLNNLLKVIDNIENGFLPHYAQIINEKMEAINNGDKLAGAVDNANLLPVEKAYAKIKALVSKGGATSKAIARNPLFFIDELFGNFKSTPIFKSIFEPVSRAFSVYQSEINTINDKMDVALKAISKSYGRNPNKVQKSKQKMMAYLLQKEFQANPNSKEVNSAKAFLDETIKYIEESEEQNNYSERDLQNLKELRDTLFASEEVDLEAIFNTFNKAEKNAINVIDQINSELSPKVSFTSTIIRGRKVGAINQYVHHNALVEKSTADKVTDLNVADVFNRSMMPSTKAKSLEERTGKATPLVFDPFSSTQRGARYLLMDYYLTEPIRTARRSLKHAENQVKGKKKRVIKAIEGALEQALSNTLVNTYTDTTALEDAISYVEKTGYRAMLASIPRAIAELSSNLAYVALYDPKSFFSGINNYKGVMMSEEGLNVMKNLRSQQIERLYPSSQLSGRLIDSQVMSQAAGIKSGKSLSAVTNAASIIYNYSGKQVKNFAETTADFLISTPDKMIMKPLWFGAFASEFKKQTGQDVDFGKLSKNDEVYMTKYKEALEAATAKADESSVRVGASDNPFTGILKGASTPNQSAMKQFFNKFNNFMTRFLIYEYSTARTGVYALMGNGSISRKQGGAILGATMARMITYSFLSSEMIDVFMSLLGFDDDEEDEDTLLQKIGQATGSALTGLLLGRNFGNLVKAPINIGTEYVNENFLDFLREGEYDPYKNSLQYTIIPKDERKKGQAIEYIKGFSGAFGPAISTAARTIEVAARSPKSPDAVERRMKELTTRTPLEILGNTGYIPLYKDVRRIMMHELYKDMKKAKSSQKRSSTGKPKPIVLGD